MMVVVVALFSVRITHRHGRVTFIKNGPTAARALEFGLSSMIMLTVGVETLNGPTALGTVLTTLARSSTGKLAFEILLDNSTNRSWVIIREGRQINFDGGKWHIRTGDLINNTVGDIA